MKPMLPILLVLCALGLVATAEAGNENKLKHSTQVLEFFGNRAWVLAPNQENCKEVPWRKQCMIARKKVQHHTALVKQLKRQMWYSIPYTNDWRTAVSLAQRPYPGTSDWLLFISHREGGYGGFVMNHQGSGAGGWMQFMSSTFYAYVDAARADFQRRGFSVPSNVWTWTHPMGQALTAAYMRYTGRDGCHWCL